MSAIADIIDGKERLTVYFSPGDGITINKATYDPPAFEVFRTELMHRWRAARAGSAA
jgi:hypothetical protein